MTWFITAALAAMMVAPVTAPLPPPGEYVKVNVEPTPPKVVATSYSEPVLLSLAEGGDADAQYHLADLYDDWKSVPGYAAKAKTWYNKAADQGHAEALKTTCETYAFGAAVELDPKLASVYCRKAADAGIAPGLTFVGQSYRDGSDGRRVDGKQAIDYLTRADEAGDTRATLALGVLYLKGKFVTKDYGRSAGLFRKALAEREMEAAFYLGQQYEKGLGVEKDLAEAGRLYFHSAQTDNVEARKWLASHPEVNKRNLAERSVTWFAAPRGTWMVVKPLKNGTTQEVDFRDMWQDIQGDRFPETALEKEIEGTVELECRWNAAGDAENCVILNSATLNYGFEKASIDAITTPVPLARKADWAQAVKGRTIRVVLKWMP